jgi:hypothetical protein
MLALTSAKTRAMMGVLRLAGWRSMLKDVSEVAVLVRKKQRQQVRELRRVRVAGRDKRWASG